MEQTWLRPNYCNTNGVLPRDSSQTIGDVTDAGLLVNIDFQWNIEVNLSLKTNVEPVMTGATNPGGKWI